MPNPMEKCFSHFLEDVKLVEVDPIKIIPTWRNSRSGRVGISKRLDHFLVAEHVLYLLKLCVI